LITARIIGGLGSGVIFILSGVYLKELMGERYNGIIVDLLITQFGLGILLQYILGKFYFVESGFSEI
jgi:MFS family permease